MEIVVVVLCGTGTDRLAVFTQVSRIRLRVSHRVALGKGVVLEEGWWSEVGYAASSDVQLHGVREYLFKNRAGQYGSCFNSANTDATMQSPASGKMKNEAKTKTAQCELWEEEGFEKFWWSHDKRAGRRERGWGVRPGRIRILVHFLPQNMIEKQSTKKLSAGFLLVRTAYIRYTLYFLLWRNYSRSWPVSCPPPPH